MLQLVKYYSSVFEGIILFSEVYVPQYQVVIKQVPGKCLVFPNSERLVWDASCFTGILKYITVHRLDLGMSSELHLKSSTSQAFICKL